MNSPRLVWGGIAVFAILLVGGSAIPLLLLPSVFTPATPRAGAITGLFGLLLGTGALIFLLIELLLFYATTQFRQRADGEPPRQTFGNTRLELTWTGIPIAIVIVAFVLSIQTMTTTSAPPARADQALEIEVVGHQWWWEFRYPAAGISTANELHLPAGQSVRLRITSADVIHSFWVVQLHGKVDAIPGKSNDLWVEVPQAGRYLGTCGEFCGVEHAWMRILAIVEPPDVFEAWLAGQQQPAQSAAPVDAGRQVFASKTCVNCHQIRGSTANALVGPDLTHIGSRAWLAGGVLTNTPENLARWLRNPQTVKPGNQMPATPLSEQEIAALTEYFGSLR